MKKTNRSHLLASDTGTHILLEIQNLNNKKKQQQQQKQCREISKNE